MKNGYVFPIILVFICLAAGAQQPLRIQDYYYTYDAVLQEKKSREEYIFQFDARGREIAYQQNRWSDDKKMLWPIRRAEIEYDQLGRETKSTTIHYLSYPDAISYRFVRETEYDVAGRMKVYTITETYFNSPDIKTSSFFYTYSPEGCLVRMDYQARVNGMGSNDYTELYTYETPCRIKLKQTSFSVSYNYPVFETYDYEDNNLVANREYIVQGTDTVMNFEILYAYNEQNQEISEQRTGSYLVETTYDNQGRVSLITNYTWNFLLSTWNIIGYTRYRYYNNGQPEEITYEYISAMNASTFQYRYEYNDAGNVSRVLMYQRFTLQGGTIVESNNEQLVYYRCDGVVVANEFYSVEGGTRTLTSGNKIVYLGPAPCEEAAEQTLAVYPNPSQGMITVITDSFPESYRIKVFTTSGQFIRQLESDAGILPAQLDLTSLPAGMYILTFEGNGFQASTRVVRVD